MTAYTEEYANVHRGLHYLSNAATEAYEEAREIVRGFINAPSTDQVIFTRSSTEAITSWRRLGRREPGGGRRGGALHPGASLQHRAVELPREKKGVVIKWAPVREDGSFDLEAFEALVTPGRRSSITHMSNVTGTIVPIRDVVRIAHASGAKVMVDGSQGPSICRWTCRRSAATSTSSPDTRSTDHRHRRALGPQGTLEAMPPWQGGGEMIREVTEDFVTYNEPPHRFEAGTPPIVQAIGLGAALRYMESLGREAILAHEEDLRDYAMARLSEMNSIRIFGTTKERAPSSP